MELCGGQSWSYPVVAHQHFRVILISLNSASESQDTNLIAHRKRQHSCGLVWSHSKAQSCIFHGWTLQQLSQKLLHTLAPFQVFLQTFQLWSVGLKWPVQRSEQQRGVQGSSCAVHTSPLHVPTSGTAWHFSGSFIWLRTQNRTFLLKTSSFFLKKIRCCHSQTRHNMFFEKCPYVAVRRALNKPLSGVWLKDTHLDFVESILYEIWVVRRIRNIFHFFKKGE